MYSSVKRSFSTALAVKVIVIVLAVQIIESSFLYLIVERSFLGYSYGEALFSLDILKNRLLRDSISMYALLALIASAGVVFIGIVYSHRVAGPLYRLRRIAEEVSGGNLAIEVRLRKNDIVKPLADSVNDMLESYRQRRIKILVSVERMQAEVRQLESALKDNDGRKIAASVSALISESSEVESVFKGLKL
jgi:HAMP domain-containing protein